ncbi:hypothetical protein DPMN_189429 [Dreissena polymorpha]|uniref:Uncharacterized protein n=1 Tax=Dreissena polymorpha TaxID=45954 RepID=A0A9D4ICB9_DREPO|nr:hypothetical protein DPMN_189429 [Dreissena polymorpha]
MSVNVRLTATIQSVRTSCTSASSSVKLTRNEHVWVWFPVHITTTQNMKVVKRLDCISITLIQEL